mgnify:CR=1 FL=1
MSDRIEQQLKTAYLQLGYQMQVQRLPAGRSLIMTNAGEFDGELFRIADQSACFYQTQRQERLQLLATKSKAKGGLHPRLQNGGKLYI